MVKSKKTPGIHAIYSILFFLIIFGTSHPISAVTITEVGGLDPLFAVTSINPSSQSESEWLTSLNLGTSFDSGYIELYKLDLYAPDGSSLYPDFFQTVTDDSGTTLANQYAFQLKYQEGYFMFKTGKGSGGSYDHWLFKNDLNSDWGTFIIGHAYTGVATPNGTEQVSFNINDITSISHIVPVGFHTPEPATFMLFGFGLIGAAVVGRRKKTHRA